MNHPFFSIIIPTLNEQKHLPLLLSSIAKQTNEDFEVVVVDNFSQDKTKRAASQFKGKIKNFRYVEKKCRNVSQGRNYGASMAKGTFLIFLDADTEIEEKFIDSIKKKILKYNLDATTVWNRAKEKPFSGRIIFFLLNLNMSFFQKIKPAANGPCIIIRKKIFDEISGFDDQIVFGEDFDLIQRAYKEGASFKVFRTPRLYVSARRFNQEGLLVSLYKSLKAIAYQLFFGPIKKPIFDYKMGGDNFK